MSAQQSAKQTAQSIAPTKTTSSTTTTTTDAPIVDRTVDQRILAPVVHEHITKKEQEDIQTVIEKEEHQDIYHTTVQPVKDTEIKPEQHKYEQAAVANREFDHDDASRVQARLAEEAAQFRNTVSEGETQRTRVVEPEVVSEHKHIHIHETIQPVIEKETVVPTVIHTTVPIHEVHHEASVFEGTSVAPVMTAEEFKKLGGKVAGAAGAAGSAVNPKGL